MTKTILFLTLRRLARDRLFVLINITGLALAFSCSLILSLYVADELSYDKHHQNHDRLYRFINLLNNNGFIEDFSRVPPPMGPLLKRDFGEVEDYVRLRGLGDDYLMRYEDTSHYWNDMYFADNSVFSLFTHNIIAGDPATALLEPLSIAVSESFARAYFGDEPAIGKTISSETSDYRINLVFKDLPRNSHLRYDALISYARLGVPSLSDPDLFNLIRSTSDFTYLLMPSDYNYESFGETIGETLWQRYLEERFNNSNSHHQYYLEPLTDIHLYSTTQADLPRGSLFAVQCFVAIIVFLIAVAVINYVNLSTAFGSKRINQNYLKRLLGENKSSILWQSILESLLLVVTAFVFGIVIAELLLSVSPINQLLAKDLSLTSFLQPLPIFALLLLAIGISILCGLFPAIGLIRNSNIQVRSMKVSHNSPYRLITILVQFTLTVGVIALSIVMYTQINYLLTSGWGFDKDKRITTRIRGADMVERYNTFRNRLLEHPNIVAVSASAGELGHGGDILVTGVETNDGDVSQETLHMLRVRHEYLATMNMSLAAGRSFDPNIATDQRNSAVVNEAVVRKMGWDNAIGKRLGNPYVSETATIIGVVKDFHLYDLGRTIEPTVLLFDDVDYSDATPNTRARTSRIVTLHYDDESAVDNVVAHLNKVWNEFGTVHPFQYQFLDESLDNIYTPYEYQMLLVAIFAIVSIFIACLGLFGLTVFVTQQRTKEIGIRKVLGASSRQIIALFFKPILIMIAIASAIASVMGFLAVEQWLESFAYRIDIGPLPFLVASGFTVVIALVTVGIQSNRSAQQNPVNSLRFE